MVMKKKMKTDHSSGQKFVDEILADMDSENVDPTAQEKALLESAKTIIDRMTKLEEAIQRDGEIIQSATGIRVHPAVAEYRQYAATLPKVLAGIIIGDSSGKNPVKVKAAQTRWNEVARREQLRKEAAGL